MNILFLGDIVGKGGRRVVKTHLKDIKKREGIDFCIANCENLAGGHGVTVDKVKDMQLCGIDFFTSGNHIWGNKKVFEELDNPNFPVIRPANYPELSCIHGRGYDILKNRLGKFLIINLIGRVFMAKDYDCPFRAIDNILKKTKKHKFDAIIVDFHAEATSEKIALKHYIDGRVTILVGTHTHIPTSDYEITEKNMAYITDLGMCGPIDSVIGMKKEPIIESFLTQLPTKFDVETGKSAISGIVIKVNKGVAEEIKQIKVSE